MNPWYNIDIGKSAPSILTALIEVPKGSKNKYEVDKASGLIRLYRVLFSSVRYPENYGFIPQTYAPDNDPLDILVLGQEAVVPLTLLEAKPIGLLRMFDQGFQDDKIIAVHNNDPDYKDYESLEELPKHRLREIESFFRDYKVLEGKKVEVEKFYDKQIALKAINESILSYKKKFSIKSNNF